MAARYRCGRFELLPGQRQLLIDGAPAPLRARAFDLLQCLIERRDELVSKNELMALVWPGLVVEENNLTVQVSAVRKVLGTKAITTVPGRGYRFALPVTELGVDPPLHEDPPGATRPDEIDLSLPEKPSIAVLPFVNLSGDPAHDYLCDGTTEEIITELARFHCLFVIARNSTFSYKGKAVDVRSVAKELGVRYVLEGSIRCAAERVRVTAQLIDAITGNHIWAEKYDRVLQDILYVQEDVTQAIVAAVAPQVETSEAEKSRRPHPGNLSAYELAMRAWSIVRSAMGDQSHGPRDEALRLARSAVAIDPHCVLALRMIAYIHWEGILLGPYRYTAAGMQEALGAADRAIAEDNADHAARLYKGMLLILAGHYEEGLADMRRAHELSPNASLALAALGYWEAMCGDGHAGIQYVKQALRLSPRDPNRFIMMSCLAGAYFAAGEYANARDAAKCCAADRPGFMAARLCLAMTCAALGDIAAAKTEFEFMRAAAPEFLQTRLDGKWRSSDAALRERATRLLQIAAGPPPKSSPAVPPALAVV